MEDNRRLILALIFRESMEHLNPSFNPNGTITATPIHPLTWVPHLSNGTEEDILILPNIALLVSFCFFPSKTPNFETLGSLLAYRFLRSSMFISGIEYIVLFYSILLSLSLFEYDLMFKKPSKNTQKLNL